MGGWYDMARNASDKEPLERRAIFSIQQIVTFVVAIVAVVGGQTGYNIIVKPQSVTEEASSVDKQIMSDMKMKAFADSLNMVYLRKNVDDIKQSVSEIKEYIRRKDRATGYGPISMAKGRDNNE